MGGAGVSLVKAELVASASGRVELVASAGGSMTELDCSAGELGTTQLLS